ncbi:hypothetical protein BC938DRAFT_472824 [Jimgerdemannia flammicorona]|uniref:Uncharacterized protein n=1 Tax=Jimgerdemannia flammicorona TaxID=994334 RepID=A0A433Q5B0_9FUNG|nr:hypothetical protein BC938DRAFT_472824 [Jimgerdemannia flammicorona]
MDSSSVLIFSGGSACNNLVHTFQTLTPNVCYVLGVSDNGGSTSELLRVLGGPSIGDLRSRLTRLIGIDGQGGAERAAIKDLLSYRLPAVGHEHAIKDEWAEIVEGRHRLWYTIPEEKKETIRGFLVLFDYEILKRAHKKFNFRNGSIGNFFLTGARVFFGSLEAAIFLFAAITGIAEPTTVVPVINTNHTATIAALLDDGQTLVGQCEISHPSTSNSGRRVVVNPIDAFSHIPSPTSLKFTVENENSNLIFSKTCDSKLASRIHRLFYINKHGQEIFPYPNPKVPTQLATKRTLVYSIGSLYTSILPCLILRSIGDAIASSSSLRHKILILNGTNDRETDGYTALDFVNAVTDGLNASRFIDARRSFYNTINEAVNGQGTSGDGTSGDGTRLPRSATLISRSPSSVSLSLTGYPMFPPHLFVPNPASTYITHLVYLDNSGVDVDVEAVWRLGIECVQCEGGRDDEGGAIYVESRLVRVLEEIMAK